MSKLRRKQLEITLSDGPTDGIYGTTNAAGITNADKMEDAFDKMEVILDALVPPNSPIITSSSAIAAGVTGKLSFGTSNTIANYDNAPGNINSLYTVTGNTRGIINATTSLTGVLANNVSADTGTPNPAYPANSFSPGNSGTLQLKLDNVVLHSVDLAVFGSGTTANGNGSGFTLSAATSAVFPGGTPFPSFKYRTGTWTINVAEWAASNRGYKTVQITHITTAGTNNTQTYDYVVDGNTATITASGPALDALNMTGSKTLSGVTYHTAGSAEYDVTLSGVYPYTYSSNASAIFFVGTNCTAVAQAVPNLVTNENNTVVITNKAVTVTNSGRLLGAALTLSTSVLRTVQTTVTNLGPQTQFALLLDNITVTSTASTEQFNDEVYRIHNGIESNKDDITTWSSVGASNYSWVSSNSLVGGSATHNNGLMTFNSTLRYPSNTTGTSVTTGNFGAVANAAGGNPNYSSATGTRVYYRFYHRPSQSNFVMNVTATSVTFVSVATGVSANNVTIEILAPSQTKNGSNVTEFKDCVVAATVDSAIGAYNAAGGGNVGNIAGANWGLTIGTKTTANSGNVVVLKITTAAAWTGSIDTINIV
jgi:hypothetical protein